MHTPDPALVAEIRRRLDIVRSSVEAACLRVGRAPDSVTLIAVTKTFPIDVVHAAVAAGVTDFGENRVQELAEKAGAVPGAIAGGTVRWHLIGSLQRNKARDAVGFGDYFHALDSNRLAEALDRRAERAGRELPCFVQVNVSGEDTKSGVRPNETHAFLDGLGVFQNLRIEGLMTLAAPARTDGDLESVVRPQFRRLKQLAGSYTGSVIAAGRCQLSMGMSGDYEIAIEEGATYIRVGSALFGNRG